MKVKHGHRKDTRHKVRSHREGEENAQKTNFREVVHFQIVLGAPMNQNKEQNHKMNKNAVKV